MLCKVYYAVSVAQLAALLLRSAHEGHIAVDAPTVGLLFVIYLAGALWLHVSPLRAEVSLCMTRPCSMISQTRASCNTRGLPVLALPERGRETSMCVFLHVCACS